MRLAILFCFLCMFAAYAAQSASLYRWEDSGGNVHYTDQPPPPTAKGVEEKTIQDGVPQEASLPYATREAAKNFPVILFSANCGKPCIQAREYLLNRGVPFEQKDASAASVQEELRKRIGAPQVPVLVVGRIAALKGFEAEQWSAALDAAGYPRSGLAVPPRSKGQVGGEPGKP